MTSSNLLDFLYFDFSLQYTKIAYYPVFENFTPFFLMDLEVPNKESKKMNMKTRNED
jgi:hypothetical protein